jgi:8-oxo-dGTP pyrophosphatase MutT (NUDIX family)
MKRFFLTLLYKIYIMRWWFTRSITVGVRLLLIKDGQVVLVKHTYQEGWYLVGGGIKQNETPEEAGRREAREEAGAQLGSMTLFGIFTQYIENRSDHIIVFVCNDFTLVPVKDFEIESVQLFPVDKLPEDIRPACKRRIEEYLSGQVTLRAGFW